MSTIKGVAIFLLLSLLLVLAIAPASAQEPVRIGNVVYLHNTPNGGDFTVQFDLYVDGYRGYELNVSVFAKLADGSYLLDGNGNYVTYQVPVTPGYDSTVYNGFQLTISGDSMPLGETSYYPHIQVNYGNETLLAVDWEPMVAYSSGNRTAGQTFALEVIEMQIFSTEDFWGDELYFLGTIAWDDANGRRMVCPFRSPTLTDDYEGGIIQIAANPCWDAEINTNDFVRVYIEVVDQDGSYPGIEDWVGGYGVELAGDYYADRLRMYNIDVDEAKEASRGLVSGLFDFYDRYVDSDDTLYYAVMNFTPGDDSQVYFGCGDDAVIGVDYGGAGGEVYCTSDAENQYTYVRGLWN